MVRVVIDTGVLISGVYNPTGTPAGVLELARKGVIQNVTSAFILSELEHILKNKFRWDKNRIEKIGAWVGSFSEIVTPKENFSVISHAPDNQILSCALAGKASFIISGDHHLTGLAEFRGIRIVNPAVFLQALDQEL